MRKWIIGTLEDPCNAMNQMVATESQGWQVPALFGLDWKCSCNKPYDLHKGTSAWLLTGVIAVIRHWRLLPAANVSLRLLTTWQPINRHQNQSTASKCHAICSTRKSCMYSEQLSGPKTNYNNQMGHSTIVIQFETCRRCVVTVKLHTVICQKALHGSSAMVPELQRPMPMLTQKAATGHPTSHPPLCPR